MTDRLPTRGASAAYAARSLAMLGVLVLLLAGCSNVDTAGDKGYVSGSGQITQIAPADRGNAVEIEGTDLDGEVLSLSDSRGQVVVINVWGAWCADCRVEMPDLKKAAERTPDAAYLGINIRDSSPAQAQSFLRGVNFDLPSFYDPGSQFLLAFEGAVNPKSTPSTVVLDRQGRTAAVVSGRLPSATTLVNLVEEIQAESADG